MDNELKVNVTTTGDKVLFGNDFIELKDLSLPFMHTSSLSDFIQYIKDNIANEPFLFLSEHQVQLFTDLNASKEHSAIAEFMIIKHKAANVLSEYSGRKILLKDFIHFLERMELYLTETSLNVLSSLKDLKIKRVMEFEHKKDHQGNFAIGARCESGNEDYEFPKKIRFEIPLIKNSDALTKFEFRLTFDWDGDKESGFSQYLMIENFEFEDLLNDAIQSYITEVLEAAEIKNVYRGRFSCNCKDDSWKYQRNELKVSGF